MLQAAAHLQRHERIQPQIGKTAPKRHPAVGQVMNAKHLPHGLLQIAAQVGQLAIGRERSQCGN